MADATTAEERARLAGRLREALESADRGRIEPLVAEALRDRPALEVIEGLLVPALVRLGDDWSAGKVSLSQLYLSGRVCEELVERVLPARAPARKGVPRHAIAVLEDHHLLGKRIVLAVLRASGFDVLDFGRMEARPLVERVVAEDVGILLVSTLMLPSALRVKVVRELLDAAGRRVRIAVGGAPFVLDPALGPAVGADATGRNAADAVTIVGRWMQERAP